MAFNFPFFLFLQATGMNISRAKLSDPFFHSHPDELFSLEVR